MNNKKIKKFFVNIQNPLEENIKINDSDKDNNENKTKNKNYLKYNI